MILQRVNTIKFKYCDSLMKITRNAPVRQRMRRKSLILLRIKPGHRRAKRGTGGQQASSRIRRPNLQPTAKFYIRQISVDIWLASLAKVQLARLGTGCLDHCFHPAIDSI